MTKALEWFRPRYEAFKADPTKVITVDDVLALWPELFMDAAGIDSAVQSSMLNPTCRGDASPPPAACANELSLVDHQGTPLPSCTLLETVTYPHGAAAGVCSL